MAAPTSNGKSSKNPLPTESRPYTAPMLPDRHAPHVRHSWRFAAFPKGVIAQPTPKAWSGGVLVRFQADMFSLGASAQVEAHGLVHVFSQVSQFTSPTPLSTAKAVTDGREIAVGSYLPALQRNLQPVDRFDVRMSNAKWGTRRGGQRHPDSQRVDAHLSQRMA